MVSLPKNWIDDLHLKTRSHISLVRNPNNSITLYREETGKRTRVVASTGRTDSKESIRRKIIACYLAGYSIIEINTKGVEIPSSHRSTIRDLVRTTMMGTEIIEASSERMVLQVLTQLAQLPFKVALRRMYVAAANMHRDAIHALKESDVQYADEVVRMDDEVDRFSLYMMRNLSLALENMQVLMDSGLKRPSECLEYRTIVRCVERIADHGALIAKKVKYLKNPIDEPTIRGIEALSEKSLVVFENAMDALARRDYALAERTASRASKVTEEEKRQMDALRQNGNIATLKLILEDIRRTAEYSSDIAEVVMDGTVQTVVSEI